MELKICKILLAAISIMYLANAPVFSKISRNINIFNEDDKFVQCIDSGDARKSIKSAVFVCFYDEIGRRDKILNKTYQSVLGKLLPAGKAKLRALEQQWIKDRETQCMREAGIKTNGPTGSDEEIFFLDCQIFKINERIDWLKIYKT